MDVGGVGVKVIWTKSIRTATFFREAFPNPQLQMVHLFIQRVHDLHIFWALDILERIRASVRASNKSS